jgi:8-oxo-dGTP pyrophosphatase MutT (NUDIX family)
MTAAVPRDAATVVVVRETGAGLEVLLLQRAERGDHNSGAWVFPGGLLDPADRAGNIATAGLSDAQASARLDLDRGGLAFFIAAIRECFEESGILFAQDVHGALASLEGHAGAGLAALRHELKDGACDLTDICRSFSLRLAPEQLHYIGHWLTPAGRAKRFDTRFFLAIAPPRQTAMHDASETLDHVWIAPREALSPVNARRLMTPTCAMLELLLPFASADSLAAWAGARRQVDRVLPLLAMGPAGLQPLLPGHPAYDEISKLDPEGRGGAWSEPRPDVPVRIGEHVERTTSADGRNSYRAHSASQGWQHVDAASVLLVEEDRIVIAPDGASVPEAMRASADWLALPEGFRPGV